MAAKGKPPRASSVFDIVYYLGSAARGVGPRYNEQEMAIIRAATLGLLAALGRPSAAAMRSAAKAINAHNRHHFHSDPNK